MKVCPRCDRRFDDTIKICPNDGSRLIRVTEEPEFVGQVVDGRFKILEKIGAGGAGTIYKAYQQSMDREVAIKILRRDHSADEVMVKRFFREAQAASRLSNPNTITLFDFGQTNDGLLYIVMELLRGHSLEEVIRHDGPLELLRTLRLAVQVCNSLAEAHEQSIVHRDLKPQNIFIEKKKGFEEFVKILDFGIAKVIGQDIKGMTKEGAICGTPDYMSPEQIQEKPVDQRTDIYSLGVILYEMLVGEPPFTEGGPMRIMIQHMQAEPPPLHRRCPSVPMEVRDIIMRCLSKKPDDRPRDAELLRREIQAYLDTQRQPASARVPHRGGRTPEADVSEASAEALVEPLQATASEESVSDRALTKVMGSAEQDSLIQKTTQKTQGVAGPSAAPFVRDLDEVLDVLDDSADGLDPSEAPTRIYGEDDDGDPTTASTVIASVRDPEEPEGSLAWFWILGGVVLLSLLLVMLWLTLWSQP